MFQSRKALLRHLSELFADSPDYPSSAATLTQSLEITAKGSAATWGTLLELCGGYEIPEIDAKSLQPKNLGNQLGQFEALLRTALDDQGSDKGSYPGYSLLYAALLLEKRRDDIRILEVGLGTNNISIPSNMGRSGRPGASLRAWKSAIPSASIVGLDVDEKVLFQDVGISTFRVDQLQPSTWDAVPANALDGKFDLIIDDGLHAPIANLNTLGAVASLLRPGGVIVIEDVPKRALPIWSILNALGFQSFEMRCIKFDRAFCIVLGQRNSFPQELLGDQSVPILRQNKALN